MDGYRTLEPGARVDVNLEGPLPAGEEQEGYRFRATSARPVARTARLRARRGGDG